MADLIMEAPEWGMWAGVVFGDTDFIPDIEDVFGPAHPDRWRKVLLRFDQTDRITSLYYPGFLVNNEEDAVALSLILDPEQSRMVKYS